MYKQIQTLILPEIADIKQGYQFRKSIELMPSGNYQVIQMANINNQLRIDWKSLFSVGIDNIKNEYLLSKNDILFCARGINNYNILIDQNIKDIIVCSQFLVIKLKSNSILPAYLSWYLNQPEVVLYFKKNTYTSTVPLINKSALENLEILLPPLEDQALISNINQLVIQEKELTQLILE